MSRREWGVTRSLILLAQFHVLAFAIYDANKHGFAWLSYFAVATLLFICLVLIKTLRAAIFNK